MIKDKIKAIQDEIKERFGIEEVDVAVTLWGSREHHGVIISENDANNILNELEKEIGENCRQHTAEEKNWGCKSIEKNKSEVAVYYKKG